MFLGGGLYNKSVMKETNNQSINTDPILFVTKRPDVVMAKGKGAYLWDTNGKKYLDFIGGWAVTCLGHCPDVLVETLSKQAKTLINASPQFYNDQMLSYAELLVEKTCMDKVFFCSTGSEANESAIKLARKYGVLKKKGAFKIVTTLNSFHGRTLTTMSATGKPTWKTLFEPKSKGFSHVPFNDLEAMKTAIDEDTCAVLIELIQGEGGVNEVSQSYIDGLRRHCDETGTLLIFDEVQTGFGRTGKLFAYEHYGVEPDILTLAKGMGSGYPIAAMMCQSALDIFEPGDQGGTYTAQPLGMAVGKAVLETLIKDNLSENAYRMGAYLKEELRKLPETVGVQNIRGKGLLIAFDLSDEKGSELVDRAMEKGLIINSPKPNSIRLIPPLIITPSHCDEFVTLLKSVLSSVYQ